MNEKHVVDRIVNALQKTGFIVATEVANFYRSADIAAVDPDGMIWIIECKVSSVGRAIEQTKTHKISADKVFIGLPFRDTRKGTIDRIKEAGVGLIYVMPDGSIKTEFDVIASVEVWGLANERLRCRIKEAVK